ncbi:hypothetical protein PF005_g6973 [Phytophthora fragariae]|uniref:Uncharacterized protein n=1 Tax=Phytophthora fragariae TaxID=53985 RepID=A0A6A3ZU68_9STRA|nr:hypothetical protein PF003_g23309 [Phytophthora fragariae]KAE9149405.1 hypothetical protein PF006_g6113 [Phytophthora fragariae]KAE9221751.1 hypothetical protein PF005_g6973 [Phytophthora fragariae]KAE9244184.1 hypothetical protein PF002_g7899 [Phytophthora fragariae]KAE9318717.1 hypothetical protein PF001_g6231 [Phytophthora fragariae]
MPSTPEYWIRWYKETLAASEAAKQANRDFRTNKEGEDASPGGTSVLSKGGREHFTQDDGVTPSPRSVELERPVATDETIVKENIGVSLCSARTTTIASVTGLTTPETRRLLPFRWRAQVLRVVYQLVKAEEQLGVESCHSFSSPLSPRLDERKEPKADDSPKDCDLAVRARSVIKRSVTTKDEQLIGKLMNEVVDAYTANATLIQSKVVVRGSRCR